MNRKQKMPLRERKAEEQLRRDSQTRNRKDKLAQRSMVAVEEKDSVSDSYEGPQPDFGGVAIVGKSQNYLNPQIINAHPRLAGMKCHDLDCIVRVKASESSSDRRESLDEVEAYLVTDGTDTNDLFGRSNSLVNSKMQRILQAMHQKRSIRRTSIKTLSQRLVCRMRMAASALHLNQMKRLWTSRSVRVR